GAEWTETPRLLPGSSRTPAKHEPPQGRSQRGILFAPLAARVTGRGPERMLPRRAAKRAKSRFALTRLKATIISGGGKSFTYFAATTICTSEGRLGHGAECGRCRNWELWDRLLCDCAAPARPGRKDPCGRRDRQQSHASRAARRQRRLARADRRRRQRTADRKSVSR